MGTLKDKFESYTPVPDEKLWDEISSSLTKNRIRRRVTAASAVVAVGVGAVALLFAWNNQKTTSVATPTNNLVASENFANVALDKNEAVMEPETVAELFHKENSVPDAFSCDFLQEEVAVAESPSPAEESREETKQDIESPTVAATPIASTTPAAVESKTVVEPVASSEKPEAKPTENTVSQVPQRRINPKLPPQELAVWIPNAFSPDDPVEESARIFKAIPNNDASIRSFEIYIYSRSGRLVFHSKDINEGWDGTANGQKLPMGTYVYIIELNDAAKGLQHTKGSITLLR